MEEDFCRFRNTVTIKPLFRKNEEGEPLVFIDFFNLANYTLTFQKALQMAEGFTEALRQAEQATPPQKTKRQ